MVNFGASAVAPEGNFGAGVLSGDNTARAVDTGVRGDLGGGFVEAVVPASDPLIGEGFGVPVPRGCLPFPFPPLPFDLGVEDLAETLAKAGWEWVAARVIARVVLLLAILDDGLML